MTKLSLKSLHRLEIKNLECAVCGAAPFTQKALNLILARLECPDQFSSHVCTQKFRKENLLKEHKNIEHQKCDCRTYRQTVHGPIRVPFPSRGKSC